MKLKKKYATYLHEECFFFLSSQILFFFVQLDTDKFNSQN
jgi:hypothetical protein